MSEKQAQIEEIQSHYREEQQQLRELETRFNELEVEFNAIMEDRRIQVGHSSIPVIHSIAEGVVLTR